MLLLCPTRGGRESSLEETSFSGAEWSGQCGCVPSRPHVGDLCTSAGWRCSQKKGALSPHRPHAGRTGLRTLQFHPVARNECPPSPIASPGEESQGPLGFPLVPFCGLPSPTRVRALEQRTFKGSTGLSAPDSKAWKEIVILERKIYSGHLLNKPSETQKSFLILPAPKL